MLSFYKCYAIFFKRSGASLQIFLYFCALEVMPALALWGVLMITDNYLIKNFLDNDDKKDIGFTAKTIK